MDENISKPKNLFSPTSEELSEFLRLKKNPEGIIKTILIVVGIFLTPITLAGAILGYMRGYHRLMKPKKEYPVLAPLRPVMHLWMILGSVAVSITPNRVIF